METVVAQPEITRGSNPVAPAWPLVWTLLLLLAAIGAALGTLAGGGKATAFIPTLAFMICLLASWFDAGTGRIPNVLTYMSIALGFGLNFVGAFLDRTGHLPAWLGASTISDCLMGFGIYAAAGVLALLVAGLGGGDMKLIASLGALLGLLGATPVIFWGLTCAIVYSLVNLLIRGKLNNAMQAVSLNILSIIYLKQSAEIEALPTMKIPLAIPMALGMILARLVPLGVFYG